MAVVAGQLELGEREKHIARNPGVVKDAPAVSLVRDSNAGLALKGKRTLVERYRLVGLPAIGSAVRVDEQGREALGTLDLLLEAFHVLVDRPAPSEDHGHVRETVL